MIKVLVDSSVWIGYFRGIENAKHLDQLIDTNAILTNDLILAEIVPSLLLRKEKDLVSLMGSIEKLSLSIDWIGITQFQVQNLKNGLNMVGIPDLIIAQNAIQNSIQLYSFDKHFDLMKKIIGLKIYSGK